MALASAIPPQAHSIVSMPCTNAPRAEPSRAADPSACATPTPATTPLLATAAAAAGRPVTARWPRYTESSTVPSTATPMVAPTWRIAEISAEPEPLRSADSADSAAFIACGIASPSPRPNAASHAAANPVPLPVLVVAPNASATAMIVKPIVTRAFASASGAAVRRALRRSQPGTADHADDQAADHRQQPQPAAHGVRALYLLEVLRHREEDAEHRERDKRRERRAPGEPCRPEQPQLDQRPDVPRRAPVSRRSQATKTASTAAPATIVASAAVFVQPSWPARMNP